MAQEPPVGMQRRCELCGADIPGVRLMAIPKVRTCVKCQRELEAVRTGEGADGPGEGDVSRQADAGRMPPDAGADVLRVEEDRVVVNRWSEGLMEVASVSAEFRGLMRSGKTREARALVQALPVEAQAALVTLDEDPEEALSLTGMDASGEPAYSVQVVDLLPSDMLASLIAYRVEEGNFNGELVRAMSPQTFNRTVEETMDSVDSADLRTRVSWEWLRAVAALDDFNRRADLIRRVDPAILEEALLDRLKYIDMHAVVSGVSQFRLFSEEGAVGMLPSSFIEDPETGAVLDALHEATPDLLRYIIRGAWERSD